MNGTAIPSTLVEAATQYSDSDERQSFQREASRYHESFNGHDYDVFHDLDRPLRDQAKDHTGDDKDFPQEHLRTCANPDGGQWEPVTSQKPGAIVEATGEHTDPCKPFRHYVVPAGHVFVMGDNRANSNDSRYWGSVPLANVKGRVTGIWGPLGRFGAVE